MTDSSSQTLDLSRASRELGQLYDQVTRGNRRVEIIRGDSRDACVIISKVELESLERALEILGDSDAVIELRDAIVQLCAVSA
jgi:PHD/YefM family antitoxin component YafN of YafNO toxin-antitoxin module